MIKLVLGLTLLVTLSVAQDWDEIWESVWADVRCWEEGQGLDPDTNECAPCPPGTHNVGDDCLPCPIGSFNSREGMTSCTECGDRVEGVGIWSAITRSNGATSPDECIDPDSLMSNFFEAEVGFLITVQGAELCSGGIAEMLYETAKVMPWNGRFTSCEESRDGDEVFTTMTLSLRPDSTTAWYIYQLLNMVHVYRPYINRYAQALGPLSQGLKMLVQQLPEFEELGLDLDLDTLNIEGLSIYKFTPHFHGICQGSLTYDDNIFCEKAASVTNNEGPELYSYYLSFQAAGSFGLSHNDMCSYVQSWVMLNSDRIHSCVNSGDHECRVVFLPRSCISQSESFSFSVRLISSTLRDTETLNIMGEFNPFSISHSDNEDMSFELQYDFAVVGCPDREVPIEALNSAFGNNLPINCDQLPECDGGSFLSDAGMCRECPYGSYSSAGSSCTPCGFYYTTGERGTQDRSRCFKREATWMDERRDFWVRSPEHHFNADVDVASATLNMCEMTESMQSFKDACNNAYTEDQMMLDEDQSLSSDYNLEQMVCSFVTRMGDEEFNNQMCNSQEEVVDWVSGFFEQGLMGGVMNILCSMSHAMAESTNVANCEDSTSASVDMVGEVEPMSIAVGLNDVSYAFPILNGLNMIEEMDMPVMVKGMMAIMNTMGMGDLNAITGWATANRARDMVTSMFTSADVDLNVDFESSNNIDEAFCEDTGNIRRECWDMSCEVEEGDCFLQNEADNVMCMLDPCNDCKKRFYTENDGGDREEYQCMKCSNYREENLMWVSDSGSHAFYSCPEGQVAEGCNHKATCTQDSPGDDPYIEYPNCVSEDRCSWPESIENGEWRQDPWNWMPRDFEGCPYRRFVCNDGYKPNWDIKHVGAAVCDTRIDDIDYREQGAYCRDINEWNDDEDSHDGCHFPEFIEGGRQLTEYAGDDYAVYMCYYGYVITPNDNAMERAMYSTEAMKNAYMNLHHVAWCEDDRTYMPHCTPMDRADHCGLPGYLDGGRATNVFFTMDIERPDYMETRDFDEDKMRMMREVLKNNYGATHRSLPFMAEYMCEEGKHMMETMYGNMGWCREDGSMEIPYCVDQWNVQQVEFRLVHSNEMKMVAEDGNAFGGLVQTRTVNYMGMPVEIDTGMGSGEWTYNCNDGFNDYSAGAICRQEGFRYGSMVPVPKKMAKRGPGAGGNDMNEMRMSERFAWTQFQCKYDDTLVMSHHCNAMRYEDALRKYGLRAACHNYDLAAVRCYNDGDGNVARVSVSNKKIMCQPMVRKEGNKFDLSALDLDVKFYADEEELNLNIRYKKKKGFMANYRMGDDVRCIGCKIMSRDMPDVCLAEGRYCMVPDDEDDNIDSYRNKARSGFAGFALGRNA